MTFGTDRGVRVLNCCSDHLLVSTYLEAYLGHRLFVIYRTDFDDLRADNADLVSS